MDAIFHLSLVASSFSGITINGFALAVNLWDWTVRGNLNASDYYICSVAFSNLSLQLLLGLNWLCLNGEYYGTFCQINFALMMICTHNSMLMAACMCFFYCVKIVVFNYWLLQRYSRILSESYRHVILRLTLYCTVMGLPLFWKNKDPSPIPDSPFLNISSFTSFYHNPLGGYFEGYTFFLLCFGYTFPLLCSLLAAGCIMVSLVKHMKRMRGTMEKNFGTLVKVHRRAAVTVLSIVVLIIMHFVTFVILLLKVFRKQDFRFIFCEVISRLYAPMLGIVLVRGNSKLRSVAKKIKRKVLGK